MNGNPLSSKHSKVNLLTFPSIPNSVNTIDTQKAHKVSRKISTGFQGRNFWGQNTNGSSTGRGRGLFHVSIPGAHLGSAGRAPSKIYFFDFDFHRLILMPPLKAVMYGSIQKLDQSG